MPRDNAAKPTIAFDNLILVGYNAPCSNGDLSDQKICRVREKEEVNRINTGN